MKLANKCLSILVTIAFFLLVDSCRRDKDTLIGDTNIIPQESVNYTTSISTGNMIQGGIIIQDSLRKEIICAIGEKNTDGSLKSIARYFTYMKNKKVLLTTSINKNFMIDQITVMTFNVNKTLKISDYNLTDQTVNIELYDNKLKKSDLQKQKLILDSQIIKLLSEMGNIGKLLPNSRKAKLDECRIPDYIALAMAVTACIAGKTVNKTGVCTQPNGTGSEKIEFLVDCQGWLDETTLTACRVADDIYKKLKNNKCEKIPDEVWDEFDKCLSAAMQQPKTLEEVNEGIFKCQDELDRKMENPNNGPSNGQSTGDPHLTTTDNFHYSFQGWGEFVAIKSTVDNFEVQVRQEDINNTKSATMNTALGIQTGTDIVSVIAKPFNIYVNEQVQTLSYLPISLKNGATISKITENGRDTYTVTTANKDAVEFYIGGSNSLDYILYLNSNRKGKVTGLFGNFDGDRANDLQTRDGKVIEYSFNNLYPTFTDSWRIDAQPNYAKLLHYESGKDTKSYTVRSFPASPTALAAQKLKDAETACRSAGVTSEPYLSNCIFDVAVTGDQSFARSALWNQQNNPATSLEYGSDISEIKGIRVTVSNDPGTKNDSCLLSLSTGKVFRVKDGAQHASEIDILFLYGGSNDDLYAHKPAFAADLSRQGPLLHRELLSQKWSVYKNTALESQGFVRDDNPSADNRVDAALWNYIKTTVDLRNSFYSDPALLQNRDRFDETSIIAGDNTTKSILMNKTLRRFVTQDGKMGVIRFTNWGKTATGWWLTMDIKVQK